MNAADFGLIVSSVLGVFLVMAVGAMCRMRHWLSQEADVSLARVTANVLLPALFLDRILGDSTLSSLASAWMPPLVGFCFTAGGVLLAWLIARTIGPKVGLVSDMQQRAFAICAGICNYGYIPLPLAQIFYAEAEVDLILHNVGVDLALWSVGVAIVRGSSADTSTDASVTTSSSLSRWMSRLRPAMTSPPLIAVIVALTIRSLGVEGYLPGALMKSVGWLADSSIPMGLLLSGAIIVDFLRAADWSGSAPVIGLAVGFRQLLMPVLMLSAALVVPMRVDLQQVLLLQAAMPAAVFPIVLVRMHEGDTETALRVVLSTSLAGIILIPLWMAVGAWLLGF